MRWRIIGILCTLTVQGFCQAIFYVKGILIRLISMGNYLARVESIKQGRCKSNILEGGGEPETSV